jgi:hypothetical protein
MVNRIFLSILILTTFALAADKVKSVYKVTRLSPTVLGVSCPGNGGDPAVIRNVSGVLLISCGTYSEADLTK